MGNVYGLYNAKPGKTPAIQKHCEIYKNRRTEVLIIKLYRDHNSIASAF